MMETITILHTNDVHAHLEQWPRISRFLAQEQSASSLTFDIGDAMDRVHPWVEATDGRCMVDLFNQAHYDGITIGNNEGIGNSHDQLEQVYQAAHFPVIVANLNEPTGELAHFAQAYRIYTTTEHTKIGVIGLTAPYINAYEPNGWHINLAQDTLRLFFKQHEQEADMWVLLSHLGLPTDRLIADHFPQIRVILGGHTHHVLPQGEWHGATLLAAAGKYGQYVGRVKLEINHHHLQQMTAQALPTTTLPVLTSDNAMIAHYRQLGHHLLKKKKIAQLPQTLPAVAPLDQPSILKSALEAITLATDTSLAVLNTGLFLTDFQAGMLTADEVLTCLPHSMHLIKVTLKGQDVWRFMMEIQKMSHFLQHYPIKGMGFRGREFGSVKAKGIILNAAQRQVSVGGQEVDPQAIYQLVTVDHFLFIPFFPTLELVGEIEFYMPDFLRNVVSGYLAQQYPIGASQVTKGVMR